MQFDSDVGVNPQTPAPSWKWLHPGCRLVVTTIVPGFRPRASSRGRAIRVPQRNAIFIIVGLTLCVAGLNAVEPLILKFVFDELAEMRRFHMLLEGVGLLAGLAIGR